MPEEWSDLEMTEPFPETNKQMESIDSADNTSLAIKTRNILQLTRLLEKRTSSIPYANLPISDQVISLGDLFIYIS